MIKDIEGNILQVGDLVYYARKANYHAKGELVKCTITAIVNSEVRMGKYTATNPDRQIVKVK